MTQVTTADPATTTLPTATRPSAPPPSASSRRRSGAPARQAGAASANRYKNMASNDESWEEYAESLTGKPASQRTAEENAMLDQLRQDILNGEVAPEYVYSDGESDVLPPDARGAFVAPTGTGGRGRVILKPGMSAEQRQATADEEFGEAVAARATSMGIDVADGDAGARGRIVVGGGTVTTQTRPDLFRTSESDTITVISDGVATTAAADAGHTTMTFSFNEAAGDRSIVQVQDANGRWVTVARSWVDGENDGSVTVQVSGNLDPSRVRVVNQSTGEIWVGGGGNTIATPVETAPDGTTSQVMSWEDRRVGSTPYANDFNDVHVSFTYSPNTSPTRPTDLTVVDVFHNGIGYDLDTEVGRYAYFQSFDADGDGYLDHTELQTALSFAGAAGDNIRPERIDYIMKLYGGKRSDGSWGIAVTRHAEQHMHAQSGLSSPMGPGNGKGIDDMVSDGAIRRSDDGTTLQIDFNEVSAPVWAQAAIEFTAEQRSIHNGTTVTPAEVARTGITAFELDEFTDHFLGDWKAVKGDSRETLAANFGVLRWVNVDGTPTQMHTLKKEELADMFHAGGIAFRTDENRDYIAIATNLDAQRSFSSVEQSNDFLMSFAGDDGVLSEEELYQGLLAAGMDPTQAARAAKLIVHFYGTIRVPGQPPTLGRNQLAATHRDGALNINPESGGFGSVAWFGGHVFANGIINIVAMQTGRTVEDIETNGISEVELDNAMNWLDGEQALPPGEALVLVQMFGTRTGGDSSPIRLTRANLTELYDAKAIRLGDTIDPGVHPTEVYVDSSVTPPIETQDDLIAFLFQFDINNDGVLDKAEFKAGMNAYGRKTGKVLTDGAVDSLFNLFGQRLGPDGAPRTGPRTIGRDSMTAAFTEGFLVMDPQTGTVTAHNAGISPARVSQALLQSVADRRGVHVDTIEWVSPQELQTASADVFGPENALTLAEAEGIVGSFGTAAPVVRGGTIRHRPLGSAFDYDYNTSRTPPNAGDPLPPSGWINPDQLEDSIDQRGFALTPNGEPGSYDAGFNPAAQPTPPQDMTPAFVGDATNPNEGVYQPTSYLNSPQGIVAFRAYSGGIVQTVRIPAEVLEPNHEGSGIYPPPMISDQGVFAEYPARPARANEMHRSAPDADGNVTWTVGKTRYVVKAGSKLDQYFTDYLQFISPSSPQHNPADPNSRATMTTKDPVTGETVILWAPRQHQFAIDGAAPSTQPSMTVNGEPVTVTGMIVGGSALDGSFIVGYETVDANGNKTTYFFAVPEEELQGPKGKAIMAMAEVLAPQGAVRDLSGVVTNPNDPSYQDYQDFETKRGDDMVLTDPEKREAEASATSAVEDIAETPESREVLYDEGEDLVEDGIMMSGAAMEAAGFMDPGTSDPDRVYFVERTPETEELLTDMGFTGVSGDGLVDIPVGGRRSLQAPVSGSGGIGVNPLPSVTNIFDHQWESKRRNANGRPVVRRANIRVKFASAPAVVGIPGGGTVRIDATVSGSDVAKFRAGIKATGTFAVVVEGRFGHITKNANGVDTYHFVEADVGFRFNGRAEATVGAPYRNPDGDSTGNTRTTNFQSLFANVTYRFRVYRTFKASDYVEPGGARAFYYGMNTLTGGALPSLLVGGEMRIKGTGGLDASMVPYGRAGFEFHFFTIFAAGVGDASNMTPGQIWRRAVANWPYFLTNMALWAATSAMQRQPAAGADLVPAERRAVQHQPAQQAVIWALRIFGPQILGATWNAAAGAYDQTRIGVTNLFDAAGRFVGYLVTHFNRDGTVTREVVDGPSDGRLPPAGLPGANNAMTGTEIAVGDAVTVGGNAVYDSTGAVVTTDIPPASTGFDVDIALGNSPEQPLALSADFPPPQQLGATWNPGSEQYNQAEIRVTRLYGADGEFKGFLVTHVTRNGTTTQYLYNQQGRLVREVVGPVGEPLYVDGPTRDGDGNPVTKGNPAQFDKSFDMDDEESPADPNAWGPWEYQGPKSLWFVSWVSGSARVTFGDGDPTDDLGDTS